MFEKSDWRFLLAPGCLGDPNEHLETTRLDAARRRNACATRRGSSAARTPGLAPHNRDRNAARCRHVWCDVPRSPSDRVPAGHDPVLLGNRHGHIPAADREPTPELFGVFIRVHRTPWCRNREWWPRGRARRDRKSTRLNSSHVAISYAVFCLKKKKKNKYEARTTTATSS